jgi:hypothetical protein
MHHHQTLAVVPPELLTYIAIKITSCFSPTIDGTALFILFSLYLSEVHTLTKPVQFFSEDKIVPLHYVISPKIHHNRLNTTHFIPATVAHSLLNKNLCLRLYIPSEIHRFYQKIPRFHAPVAYE